MYNELFKKVNTIKTIDASDLVKKADYDQKIDESEKKFDHKHDKYITTQEFDKSTSENFETR